MTFPTAMEKKPMPFHRLICFCSNNHLTTNSKKLIALTFVVNEPALL